VEVRCGPCEVGWVECLRTDDATCVPGGVVPAIIGNGMRELVGCPSSTAHTGSEMGGCLHGGDRTTL